MDKTGNAAPTLFALPDECCGCGACAAICPRDAIVMTADVYGYLYPVIDSQSCIGCGLCERACGFKKSRAREAQGPCYAAAEELCDDVMRSASGGVFAALAKAALDQGYTVVGCVYRPNSAGLDVVHVCARSREELDAMLGSKYAQSAAYGTFRTIRNLLRSGNKVLFSGTPCQVAGLREFLGKPQANLITVDLVCHGVPSARMLNDYARLELSDRSAMPSNLVFRSKVNGWLHSRLLRVDYPDGTSKYVKSADSSYYDLFFDGELHRDSCYSCPFPGGLRPGDFSIGDFWGIGLVRPDLLKGADGPFDDHEGISCLLVNNEAAGNWLREMSPRLKMSEVTFESIACNNDQLRHACKKPKDREAFLDAYAHGGWKAVKRRWLLKTAPKRIKRLISAVLPTELKEHLKRMFGKGL